MYNWQAEVNQTMSVTENIYKRKNYFYEMKGDKGMSLHEKERKQEDAYTKTNIHSNLIRSALKLCLFVVNALGKQKHVHMGLPL